MSEGGNKRGYINGIVISDLFWRWCHTMLPFSPNTWELVSRWAFGEYKKFLFFTFKNYHLVPFTCQMLSCVHTTFISHLLWMKYRLYFHYRIRSLRLNNLPRFIQVLYQYRELVLEPKNVSFQRHDSFYYSIFIWRKLEPYHLYLAQALPNRLLLRPCEGGGAVLWKVLVAGKFQETGYCWSCWWERK